MWLPTPDRGEQKGDLVVGVQRLGQFLACRGVPQAKARLHSILGEKVLTLSKSVRLRHRTSWADHYRKPAGHYSDDFPRSVDHVSAVFLDIPAAPSWSTWLAYGRGGFTASSMSAHEIEKTLSSSPSAAELLHALLSLRRELSGYLLGESPGSSWVNGCRKGCGTSSHPLVLPNSD